jgi:hypothetical protein
MKKNHALGKVEIAQKIKFHLYFSEVMAFARIFTHFTQNVWIFKNVRAKISRY